MTRRVVVHNTTDPKLRALAVKWGRTISNKTPDLQAGEVRNEVISPLHIPNGALIRVREDRVDVFLHDDLQITAPAGGAGRAIGYRKLAHGLVVGTSIDIQPSFKAGTPLILYDAANNFEPRKCWQLTSSCAEHANYPPGFVHAFDNSTVRDKKSHLLRVRGAMYSGLMRAVVQAAQGIGWGAEPPLDSSGNLDPNKPDLRLGAFAKVKYSFLFNRSDGVFLVERPEPVDGVSGFAARYQPVVVRLEPFTGKAYAMPLLYWETAFIGLDSPPTLEEWVQYVDEVEGADSLARPIVETFGGLPAELTPLDLETTVTDQYSSGNPLEEARAQRVAAGMVAEFEVDLGQGAATQSNEVGFSFSYTRPEASAVVAKYLNGYPHTAMLRVSFSLAVNADPTPPEVPGELIDYLGVWVNKGMLDYHATVTKLSRITQDEVDSLAASLPRDFDNWGNNAGAAKQFKQIMAPPKVTLQATSTLDWYKHVNPVGSGPTFYPQAEMKFPSYGPSKAGLYTWRHPPESGADRPASRSPVFTFYTPDGGQVTAVQESPGPYGGQAASPTAGPEPECGLEPYSWTQDITEPVIPYTVGLNVFFPRNTQVETTTRGASRGGGKFEAQWITYEDELGYPIRGWAYKYMLFSTQTTSWQSKGTISMKGSLMAPLYNREAVYLGTPPWGTSPYYSTVSTSYELLVHPVIHQYWTCLKGWPVAAQFQDCAGLTTECPKAGTPRRFVNGEPRIEPSPCEKFTGGGPWLGKCANVEEAAERFQAPAEIPQTTVTNVYHEEQTKSEVHFVSGPTGVIQTRFEESPARIAGEWTEISPDPFFGYLAVISSVENCIGEKIVGYSPDVAKDYEYNKDPPVEGAIIFVGNAIPE